MILEIQGLRALAALLVVLFHAKFISGGFLGVDIFYVISGYLITGLLLREIGKTGQISLTKFYLRRIKRLLPSSFAVLVVTAIAGTIILPSSFRNELGRDIVASALYVSNYLFAHWQNDYQNLGAAPSPVIHYWSLAVEEQFYLLWPIILLGIYRFKGREWLFRAIAAITGISIVLSICITNISPIWAFYSLPTRAWELGIGALLLWRPLKRSAHSKVHRYLGWIFIVIIIVDSFIYTASTSFPGWAALPPVIACAGLIRYHPLLPRLVSKLLSNKLSQWLGSISYPIYLWHWPVLTLAPQWVGRSLTSSERIIGIAFTLLLADLTHKFIEQPFRLSKAQPRKVVLTAITATIGSSLIGLTILFSAPASAQGFSLSEITSKPQIYGDGCQLDKRETISPRCEYGDVHGAKTVVLFGDSHAAQWFPTINAIALSQHWKLVVLTKSSCPAVLVSLADNGAFKNAPCQAWRKNSLSRIMQTNPYLVFTSNFSHYQPPDSVKSVSEWWSAGYVRLLSNLTSAEHVVVIGDTPLPNEDIPACLTKRVATSCLAQPSPPLVSLGAVKIIDPTPWFCEKRTCPAIRSDLVLYRDTTHMTVKFGLSLVPIFEKALAKIGLVIA